MASTHFRNIIEIDGSVLEGGGQILRISAALSCLTGLPISVTKIRAGRSNPGLRAQHLKGLELVRDICNGRMDGGAPGSTAIFFAPGRIQSGCYRADTQTAGSVCLLIQVALPVMLFSGGPVQITVTGGTDAEFAPPIDHNTMVFQHMAGMMGVHFNCDIRMRGYYPKGGGEVVVQTKPLEYIKPLSLMDRGHVVIVRGRAFVAGVLPIKIAHTMARVAAEVIQAEYPDVAVHIDPVKESPDTAVGNGTGIILYAETSTGCRLAGSSLGKKGIPAETVATTAANCLLNNLEHGGCVDEHTQDQLIILMALARGHSSLKCGAITTHTETAIHVATQMTRVFTHAPQAQFNIREDKNSTSCYIIECMGIGLQNPSV